MRAQALVVNHRGRRTGGPRVVPMPKAETFVIGRSSDCDVVLPEPTVSARHAEVSRSGARLRVRDLDSRNGTFLEQGGAATRLPPGASAELGPGDAFGVGPFVIAASEWIGEGVLLTADQVVGTDVPTDPTSCPETEIPAISEGAMQLALRALSLSMSGRGAGDAWTAALAGLVRLSGPGSALVASCQDERFIVRASLGIEGTVCLSRRFLAVTAARRGAWCYERDAASADAVSSPSLHGLGPDRRLVGVPFPSPGAGVVAVGYVEQTRPTGPVDIAAIDLFAALSGPLLSMSLDLDREIRRREALEARIGETSVPDRREPGSARVSRVPLVGESGPFRAAVELVEKAAPTMSTILLRGPTGAGKEQLARLTHEQSPRHEEPFVVVNCAQIPEGLIESELFGHEKGAFTGAHTAREGAFARADGGTLFLDELGDLEPAAQAKILRVIETGEVVRVGGGRRQVSVRVIAATHRDLEHMIEQGRFREDLYFRLRVVEVVLPPLARRRDDILPLVRHFIARERRADGEPVEGITDAAARALVAWGWPGNVRELRNVIERAVVLDTDGTIDIDDLPLEIAGSPSAGAPAPVPGGPDAELTWLEARKAFEKSYFERALERHGWRIRLAAESCGVTRRTLANKIREHGLQRPGRRR